MGQDFSLLKYINDNSLDSVIQSASVLHCLEIIVSVT